MSAEKISTKYYSPIPRWVLTLA